MSGADNARNESSDLKASREFVTNSVRRWRYGVGLALSLCAFGGIALIRHDRPVWGIASMALIAVAAGFWQRRFPRPEVHDGGPLLSERRVCFLLIAIFLLGAMIRLHRLGDVESRLCFSRDSTIDEAYKGQWAMEFLHGRRVYTPFIRHWGERETLYIYMESLAIFLFGRSVLTLRAVSFACGMGTLICLFLLARRWFNNRVALISAVLLAVSAWHASTNRISERFNMAPLATAFALWLLSRALATRCWRDFLLAGAGLGIGMYTFPSYRVVPVIAVLIALDELISVRGNRWRRFGGLFLLGLAALAAVLAPLEFQPEALVEHFLKAGEHSFKLARHPEDYWRNVKDLLTLFHYRFPGDMSFHAEGPLVEPLAGVLFLLGIAIIAVSPGDRRHRWLFYWLILSVAPAVASDPDPRRLGVTLPLVYLLAGIGLDLIWRSAESLLPRRVGAAVTPLLAFVVITAGAADQLRLLFLEAYPAYEQRDCPEYRRAMFLEEAGQYATVYLTHAGEYQELLKYLTMEDPHHRNDWERQTINPLENLPIHFPAERTVIYSLADQPVFTATLPLFKTLYPRSQHIEHRGKDDQVMFHSVVISPESVNAALGLWGVDWSNGTMIRAEPNPDGVLALPAGANGPVTFTGSVYSPRTDSHSFEIIGPGSVAIEIDGVRYLVKPPDKTRVERSVFLPRGLHEVTIGYWGDRTQRAGIRLSPAGAVSTPFAPCYFHTVRPATGPLAALPVKPGDRSYRRLPPVEWESPFTSESLTPACIEVGENGDVFIGDHQHVRIARYRPDGRLVNHWNPAAPERPAKTGPIPPGDDRNRPFTIAIGGDDQLLVSVEGRPRLDWYSADGVLQTTLEPTPEHMLDLIQLSNGDVLACSGSLVHWRPGWPSFQGCLAPEAARTELPSPLAVAADEERGLIYVYDATIEGIVVLSMDFEIRRRILNLGRHDWPRLALTPDNQPVFSALRITVPMAFDDQWRLLLGPDRNERRGLFGEAPLPMLRDIAAGRDGLIYLVTYEGGIIRYQSAASDPTRP